ncbi:MAG: HAMP domain-containing sensor histidine kinase [Patescibacteria group bacterium]
MAKSSSLITNNHPKQHKEYWYSLVVIIILPLLMVGGMVWVLANMQKNTQEQLKSKSSLTGEIISSSLRQNITLPGVLQQQLADIKSVNKDISLISVSTPTGRGDYIVSASTNTEKNNTKSGDDRLLLAANQKSVQQFRSNNTWVSLTPILQEGLVLGVVETQISVARAESELAKSLNIGLAVAALSAALTVILLLHHFRFVEYTELFHKSGSLDALREDFLDVTSHELQVPTGRLEHLLHDVVEGNVGKIDESAKQSLTNMLHETQRLDKLTADLRLAMQLEQGIIKPNTSEFEISGIIEEQVNKINEKANAKQLTLTYHKPIDSEKVRGDAQLVGHIIFELLENAIKFTHKGSIIVEHASDRDTVLVLIKDSGIGIDQNEIPDVFEQFYRVRSDAVVQTNGAGLGLWICDQYAKLMGAELTCKSEVNKGSEFGIHFVRAESQKN